MVQEIKITNYITVAGKTVLWNELSESERRGLADKLQENLMSIAGYRRRETMEDAGLKKTEGAVGNGAEKIEDAVLNRGPSKEGLARRTSSKKQITGIEPAFPAWEASVLPMNHICM